MAAGRKLFGTDGVRGVAGELITAELALALGRAAAASSPAEAPQVLIVRDTRESGEMLEASIAAGVAAAGGHALLHSRPPSGLRLGCLDPPGSAGLLIRASQLGHVAVVVAVSAATYTVSEMYFISFGEVNTRTIWWPDPHIQGFIPLSKEDLQ